MSTIKQAVKSDLTKYESMEKSAGNPTGKPGFVDLQPVLNTFLRSPLPPISTVSPDSLRQFYLGGQVPQMRLLTPPSNNGAGGTVIENNNISVSSSSGGGSTTFSNPAESVSVTTNVLAPGAQFISSIQMAKAFQLLSIAINSPARIQLYGTSTAQTTDLGRGINSPVAAGIGQNIITDLVLDTIPYSWGWQNRTGSNSDPVQSATIYITITNLDALSDAITVTVQYVKTQT